MEHAHARPDGAVPELRLRGERRSRPARASTFHLLTQLTAPIVRDPGNRRPSLNLAFVVDRSGSMAGGALETAKRGVEHALRGLDERDRVALVVYDDRVDTLLTLRHADGEAREKAARRLRRIESRGSTDLAGGWLTGCDELARVADAGAAAAGRGLCRALLLTDGLANVGITDADELARHARELRLRGISTSTMGVGASFDEELLARMADAGGGRYHHIPHARAIPDVFAGELGELLQLALRDVTLCLRVPAGWEVALLNDLPVERAAGELTLQLGELSSGETKSLVWELTLPEAPLGATETVEVTVRWRDASGAQSFEHRLRHAFEATDDPGEPDERVLDEVALLRGARARAEAVAYNRAGQYDRARDVAQRAAAAMPGSVAGAAEARELLETARAAGAPMSAVDLKRQHALAYRRRRSQKDFAERER